jgi:hypothetical protein
MIEHLTNGLADHMQLAAAAGASLMLGIEPHVLAGQVRRQAWSIRLRSARARLAPFGWKRGFRPRDIGLEVFKAEH